MTDIDKLKEEYKNVRAVFGAFKCHLDAAIHKAEYVAYTESIAYQKGYESGKAETEIRLLDENGEWAKKLKQKAYEEKVRQAEELAAKARQRAHDATVDVIQRGKMVEEAYEKGTKDGNVEGALAAWDIAAIIVTPEEDGGTIPAKDLRELFDVECDYEVFKRYTPSEALAKLQEYDKQIRVGDEVIAEGDAKYIVTQIKNNDACKTYSGINSDGETFCYFETDGVTKTGKHVDLSKMLSYLRGDDEENE